MTRPLLMKYFVPLLVVVAAMLGLASALRAFSWAVPGEIGIFLVAIVLVAAHFTSEGLPPKQSWLAHGWAVAATVVYGLMAGIAYRVLAIAIAGYTPNAADAASAAAIPVIFVICTAVVEEVLLRGYLQRVLTLLRLHMVAACLIQGVVFAVLHSGHESLSRFVFYAAAGCLLTSIRVSQASLLPSIGAHAGWNLWALSISPVVPGLAILQLSPGDVSARYWISATVFLLAAGILVRRALTSWGTVGYVAPD